MINVHGTADYYQNNKDSDDWSEPIVDVQKPTRRLASMISVRFSPEEVDRIRANASTVGVSVSQFVRNAALNQALDNKTISAMRTDLKPFTGRFGIDSPEKINVDDSGLRNQRPLRVVA